MAIEITTMTGETREGVEEALRIPVEADGSISLDKLPVSENASPNKIPLAGDDGKINLDFIGTVPLGRLPASLTPSAGILPITNADGKIPMEFVEFPPGFNQVIGYELFGSPVQTSTLISAYNITPQKGGPVSEVSVPIGGVFSGALGIQHLRETEDGVTVVATYNVTATTGNAVNVFKADVDFPLIVLRDETDYIGLQTITGGCTIQFVTTGGTGYKYYLGSATGEDLVYAITATGQIFYEVTITYGFTPQEIPTVTLPTLQTANENIPLINALPSGWINAGGFTFSGAGAQSTLAGINNQLRSPKTYGADRLIHRFRFRIGATTNVLGFFTIPTEGGSILAGTMIRIDCFNNTIAITNQYTGANNPADLVSTALGMTMAVGRDYQLDLVKNGRSITIQLWDQSGSGYFEQTRAASPLGFQNVNLGTYGYDQGAMHGAPGFCWYGGAGPGPILKGFETWLKITTTGGVYVIGDSITEGFSVTDAQRFGQLLRDRLGASNVLLSGIGGAVTSGAAIRIGVELSAVRPKYVIIYLGTNTDGGFTSNLPVIIATAQAVGATVIVCTIPSKPTETAFVNGLPSNVIKVKFDLAMTETGAGSALLAPLYQNTDAVGNSYMDIHPNNLGHLKQFQRLELEAPMLFQ